MECQRRRQLFVIWFAACYHLVCRKILEHVFLILEKKSYSELCHCLRMQSGKECYAVLWFLVQYFTSSRIKKLQWLIQFKKFLRFYRKYPLFLFQVRELHREFALSGADVLQAFVFNGTDDNLNQNRPKDQQLSVRKLFIFCRVSLEFIPLVRSSDQRCSMKKGVLINFTKFTGKHLCQSGLQLY